MRQTHLLTARTAVDRLNVLGETVTVLGAGDVTKPFEVHIQEGKRGGGPPPHHHPWDEAFYVLEGAVAVTVDGVRHEVSATTVTSAPAPSPPRTSGSRRER